MWIGNVAFVQYNQCAGVVPTIVDGPAKVSSVTPDQDEVGWAGGYFLGGGVPMMFYVRVVLVLVFLLLPAASS